MHISDLRTAPPIRSVRPFDKGPPAVIALLFWLVYFLNMPPSLGGIESRGDPRLFNAANPVDRTIKITMILVGVYFLFRRIAFTRDLFRYINPGLIACVIVCFASASWSISPDATFVKCITLGSYVLVCLAFALASWHPRRFQQVVLPPLMLLLIASLAIGCVSLDSMIEHAENFELKDAWHGLTYSKNEFGKIACLGVILCFHSFLAREGRRGLALIGGACALTCLILSRSNTSMFATVVAVSAIYILLRPSRIAARYTTHIVITIAGILVLYELIIQNVIPGTNLLLAPLARMVGKDTTFSARSEIWQIIKDHIAMSPWLGTGYGAYWTGALRSSPSYIFMVLMYFYPTEAHNGYLEILNDLGCLGLICLAIFIVSYIHQALRLMPWDRSQAVLFLALLFQEMVLNMQESEWLSRSDCFTVLILASVALSRSLLEVRVRLAQNQ